METLKRTCTYLLLVAFTLFSLILISCGGEALEGPEMSDEVMEDVEDDVGDMEDDSEDDTEEADEEEEVASDAPADTSLWHTYETDDFTIKYPQGWEPNQYNTFFDFRPRDNEEGGFVWSINQVANRGETAENMITGMGAQYASDRDVARSEVTIDGKEYLHVVVTTSRDEDFYYEGVFVETDEKVYFIANTDMESAEFAAFYESFVLN